MNDPNSWLDVDVRHQDGRTGFVYEARDLGGAIRLDIQCNDGYRDQEVLGALGEEQGPPGWQWYNGVDWYPLGDIETRSQLTGCIHH